jgi:hypothetical protein
MESVGRTASFSHLNITQPDTAPPFLTEAYGADTQMDADSRHFLEIG